jgi:hypothetical protein
MRGSLESVVHRGCRRRAAAFRLVLFGLLVAACELVAPPPTEVPAPTFELLGPAPPEDVALGEAVVIRIAVRGADGAPYADAETRWLWTDWFSLNPTGRCEGSTPEPGVFQCTYRTARRGWHDVKLEVSRCVGTRKDPKLKCASFESAPVSFRVWGGTPLAVHTPYVEASLVVGEERPLHGLALAQGARSHVAPSASIEDPSVAEVLDGGVVRALAPGQTSLRLRAGSAEREVSVKVVAGAPGAPPLATPMSIVHRSNDTVSSIRWSNLGANRHRDGTLALDQRGWPWLVYTTASDQTPAGAPVNRGVWVSPWTGSDFGYEYVGAGWDDLARPRLAIDDQGVAWVLAWSSVQYSYVLMRRAGPGQWSRHALPALKDPTAPTPARDVTSVVYAGDTTSSFAPMALLPRRGGGVFVAYPVVSKIDADRQQAEGGTCARFARLVTAAADGGWTAEDVLKKVFAGGEECGSTLRTERQGVDHVALAPNPAASSGPPVVLVTKFSETEGFTEGARFDGVAWSSRRLIPWADPVADVPTASKQRPIQLSVAGADGPSDAPGPTWLVWQGGGISNFYRADLEDLFSGAPTPFSAFGLTPEPRTGTSDSDVVLSAVATGVPVVIGVKQATSFTRLVREQQAIAPPGFELGAFTQDTLLRGLAADGSAVHFSWGLGDLAWGAFAAP